MTYVELHCHSAFSFLDGASHPVELANVAAQQGHEALALTDHDGLHGAMETAQALSSVGIRPITGAEVTLDDGHHLTLLCEDATGYRNLCQALTKAYEKDRLLPSLPFAEVERHAEGLVCLSGCAREGVLAKRIEQNEHAEARRAGARLVEAFGRDNLRVELQRPYGRRDRRRNRLLAQLAERLGVPAVATGNVHAHGRERAPLQDVFVAVRLGATLDESEPRRRGNSSHVLVPPEAMAERFRDVEGGVRAVHESGRLAERLRFDLTQDLGYRYPGSEDAAADRKLAEICTALIDDRYAGRASHAAACARLDEELRVIRSLGLSGFFLLHRDLLELAREVAAEVRGADAARAVLPPGRGRGSSVASIVCFLTGLSHVDPVEKGLSLGRFLNEDLKALPDIDLDFPRDIREVLIPRIHDRYGHDRSALVASFATYRNRSAIRDFGKALGLPPGEIERAARAAVGGLTPHQEGSDPLGGDLAADFAQALGRARVDTPRWRALVRLVQDAQNLPRHVSQHPGGMVISTRPLVDICPIQPAAMDGRQMVHWDKESCADAGFLKIDLLGLGMLSAVERCVTEIARSRGEVVDLSRIDFDDERVYRSIQRADTTGTFQIESRAQMQMLVRTKPESLDDLTVQVALVRPGPIIGGAVHPYIERRKALRADPSYRVPYEHPSLEAVLSDTLGAIVFQDQVIEVAMAFAGFSAGEAEGLRRAMSRARSEAAMRAYEQKFIEGGMANGASRAVAERVYGQIVGFSGFGFPKSHSAAFALLAYQSAWLREHYGPEFLCGLMNEQPMGFYPPDALVHEAQRRGITVLPPDACRSHTECRVEEGGVRMGLAYVSGVRTEDVKALVAERERGGPFRSLADLAARCGSGRETLERLAWAGACDSLVDGEPAVRRRTALWQLGVTAAALPLDRNNRGRTPCVAPVQLALPLEPAEAPRLREMTPWELLIADYGSTKVTTAAHPLELMRPELPAGVLSSPALSRARHGTRVKVAGLVVARQRPATANGVTFMLLEDEHGTINLIVPPPVHDRFRLAVRAESLVLAEGRVERREGTLNVVVERIGRLERPDLPVADVRHIEPARTWSSEAGAELRAVAPTAHSFGRRG
ncbi:MAG TPA: error-prone DNA polymerase [Thermoleophilaceae bacterium]|nr:error-prone DNA polymerase [Thermoleophilaceae bacterium]